MRSVTKLYLGQTITRSLAAVLLIAVTAVAASIGFSTQVSAQAQASNCGTPQNTQGTNSPTINVPCPNPSTCPKGACIINDYINPLVKALTASAGVIAVISIIVGGIQYSSAGGDPSKIAKAKERIMKTLGAFIFFLFLYGFLNFVIPGGV
jgi:hypothetical protein